MLPKTHRSWWYNHNNLIMKTIKYSRKLLKSISRMALGTVLLALPVSLLAQESTDSETEEVFQLSPFEVSTEGTIGYLANNTLAGTRINSELQDIANAVQVVTQEFMDDVGATDLSELLIYTTNTEVAGVQGNASFGEDAGTDINQERSRRDRRLLFLCAPA